MNEERELISHAKKKSEWIVGSGCSLYMIGDKDKFMKINKYDSGIVRFGDNTP